MAKAEEAMVAAMVVMVAVVVWLAGGASRVVALAVGQAAVATAEAVVGSVARAGVVLVAAVQAPEPFPSSTPEPLPPSSKAYQAEAPAERPNKLQRAQASRGRHTTRAAAHLASTVERAPRRRGTHPARAVQ